MWMELLNSQYMKWIIAFLGVGLVLSPILLLAPSPRQKRITKMRLKANALKLQVQVCQLPQTHRAEVRKEPKKEGAAYRLLISRKASEQVPEWLLIREFLPEENDVSDWEGDSDMINQCETILESLPDDVAAVEANKSGLAVYWQERGDEQTVALVYDVLTELRKQMGV